MSHFRYGDKFWYIYRTDIAENIIGVILTRTGTLNILYIWNGEY